MTCLERALTECSAAMADDPDPRKSATAVIIKALAVKCRDKSFEMNIAESPVSWFVITRMHCVRKCAAVQRISDERRIQRSEWRRGRDGRMGSSRSAGL